MTRIKLRHPGTGPFAGWDMQVLLDDQARRRGNHTFLKWEPFVGSSRVWSYREFADATARLAGGLAARGSGGFTLYRPDHWAFTDCKLGYGDQLGARGRIFGYEVDGLDYRIEDGLPYPVPTSDLPEDLVILALGIARLREQGFDQPSEQLFVGDDDARLVAELRYGRSDEESLARTDRGSGMIVNFTSGGGEVFHAGPTEWVAGLIRRDKAVEQVTRNVLNRFLSR